MTEDVFDDHRRPGARYKQYPSKDRYFLFRQLLWDIIDGKREGTIKELDELLDPYGRKKK